MKNILEARDLSKTYVLDRNKLRVLKGVSLQLKKGEFTAVMGPSGSGKSTLLYNISGMDRMTSGSVVFNGQELSSLSEKQLSGLRLNNMGFVFQQMHLLKNLGIKDNIVLPAYAARKKNRREIDEKAGDLMKKTGIAALADNDISQVSGGQLQRAAICRALINNPEIIFGDEPTGALNSSSSDEIMDILADINRAGTTILLVTHDVKVASKTERVLFMIDGNIVDEYLPGKYYKDRKDGKEREEKLSGWLLSRGF